MIGIGTSIWAARRRGTTFLLRDDFLTDEAAPLASPRTAEPGPGTGTTVDTEDKLTISSSRLNFAPKASPSEGDPAIVYGELARAAGRAFVAQLTPTQTDQTQQMGWATSDGGTITAASFHLNNNGTFRIFGGGITSGSVPGDAYSATAYDMAVVLRSAGGFFLVRGGAFTEWTLLYVDTVQSTASLHPAINTTGATFSSGFARITDLPAPFDTDYGLATDRHAGSVSAGTEFTHEADCIIEYSWTGATDFSASKFVDVLFRVQDATNYWMVRLKGNNTLELHEVVAGSSTVRGSASTIPYGRVVVIASGATIRIYVTNTLRITYAAATNFQTDTAGEVDRIDGDGTCSDLISWPRTLSGTAKAALDAVVEA